MMDPESNSKNESDQDDAQIEEELNDSDYPLLGDYVPYEREIKRAKLVEELMDDRDEALHGYIKGYTKKLKLLVRKNVSLIIALTPQDLSEARNTVTKSGEDLRESVVISIEDDIPRSVYMPLLDFLVHMGHTEYNDIFEQDIKKKELSQQRLLSVATDLYNGVIEGLVLDNFTITSDEEITPQKISKLENIFAASQVSSVNLSIKSLKAKD